MYVIHCRIAIDNPLTPGKLYYGKLYYNVAVVSGEIRQMGDIVKIWNADRSGTVDAEVYNVTETRRQASDFKWQIVE